MASFQLLDERQTAPYDVPETLPAGRGVHILRTAIVMPFITFMFICMRFYSKLVMKKVKLRLDDYIVGATFLFSIAHAVLMANATYNGMGLHIWQYTPDLNARYYLWIGISSEFYAICLMGFKSSLILLYLQLFGDVNRKFRWCCYALLVYTCGYITCNMFTEFLGCQPIEKKWNQSVPGHCINSVAANIAYGFGHMSSDLMIGILPLPMIWKMRFKTTKEKIGLSLVLTCGFIAWAVACVRWAIGTYNMLSYDRPWWAGISFLFSILEVHTGIICCCVATSGPFLRLFFKNIKTVTARTAARYGSSSDGSASRTRHSISVAKSGVRRLSQAAMHPGSIVRGHLHSNSKSSRPSISGPIIEYPASTTMGTPPMADVSQMRAHRHAPPAPPTFMLPLYGTDTRTSGDTSIRSHSDFTDSFGVPGGFFSPTMDGVGPHDATSMSAYGRSGSGERDKKRMSDEENLLRIA
ncbi:uncharacterized protein B0I36DRAFT_128433 [Microdochium trichocladiopsis]|uniref:Rhodopsin domain-containing protein n=1 Tax=Microdochium trichocladiopsis TaxID=1682393 RepID=A0A9P8Y4X6_9PEZI|nr:uncharacterized protein B0I36DRAFT_128433 [Microdochium trichocladiopsis]KAH7029115.1 hypothetical protein B0I36DRAFT_128433 [Microdochium trichocladiopsis]